jgi:hypothetical protein
MILGGPPDELFSGFGQPFSLFAIRIVSLLNGEELKSIAPSSMNMSGGLIAELQ